MKSIASFLFLFISVSISTLGQAQSVASVSRQQFQAEVHNYLSKQEGGEYLYAHADSYRKLVNFLVRKQLGLIHTTKKNAEGVILAQDSSRTFDASKTADDQDETSVAINHLNKSVICIGANEDGDDGGMFTNGMPVFTSTDKGASWKSYRLPQPANSSFYAEGDPILAADDKGNFFYAYLAGDGTPYSGDICIARSPDGISWSNATAINININVSGSPDKEHMCIDNSPTSPHYGRVYVVWFEFYNNPSQKGEGLNVVWSDDKCQTWSKPTILGIGDNFQEIKTNGHGDVLLSFTNSAELGQELFVSTDGGKTFVKRLIPVPNSFTLYPERNPGNGDNTLALKGSNGFRSFPYVAYDVDPETNKIHAVYGNYEDTPDGTAAVLYYATSENNGVDWTTPQVVGVSNPAHSSLGFDRFHPWVSLDPITKEVSVLYYSSEQDPNNILSAPYRMKLTDAMKDLPEVLHSQFDPTIVETEGGNQLPFIGDYNGSDAYDSIYIATWTENRKGNLDGEIYAYLSYPKPGDAGVGGNPIVIHSSKLWLSAPYPNPINGSTVSLSYYAPHSGHILFGLFDLQGKQVVALAEKNVESGSYTDQFSFGNIAAGTYYIRMSSGNESATTKIVVVRE